MGRVEGSRTATVAVIGRGENEKRNLHKHMFIEIKTRPNTRSKRKQDNLVESCQEQISISDRKDSKSLRATGSSNMDRSWFALYVTVGSRSFLVFKVSDKSVSRSLVQFFIVAD